jgi:3-phosphoshikimate 1-carboxyvinyltransferase
MALPEILEIEPPPGQVRAVIGLPGSKSLTNRALVLAALARGRTALRGALWSEDTQVMVEALRVLGFDVRVGADPGDRCNRRIEVAGSGGEIRRGGTSEAPLELWVGNAGTAARFLAALACLGQGVYRLTGVPRMHERPQAALFAALRQLGYRIDAPNDRLPALVHGSGPRPGSCRVSMADSSQFASALLLAASAGGWTVSVDGYHVDESPYVTMTQELVTAFPGGGGEWLIEPDASGGSYFWAADWLLRLAGQGHVEVADWPSTPWQVDARFPDFLPLPARLSRARDLGDSIMTAMVLAPFAPQPVAFADLGRLRVQECDRVSALCRELRRCGARVEETADGLRVAPGPLHGAEVETYDDHRMAMCFAILGLRVAGMRIKNPRCVRKTFPNFFQKLGALEPHGLGLVLRDATTGTPLAVEQLMAD